MQLLDFQSDNELGRNVAAEYKDAARRAGRPFIPIYLLCDLAENLERVMDPGRVNSGTTKLTDIDILKQLRSSCELARFSQCHSLTLDSSNMPPLEAAAKLLAFVDNSSGKPTSSVS